MEEWWLTYVEPDGLLLRDKVLAAEDPDRLLIAMRSGRIRRVQRGIYIPRSLEYTPLVAARAAILSSGIPHAVASHATAARVHGIEVMERGRCEHVTVSGAERRRNRKDLRFHTRACQLGDVRPTAGVPVTNIPRTLADLAVDLDQLPAVWALDDALRRGMCDRADIERTIGTWLGGRGCVRAAKRLAEADGLAESPLETAARLALAAAGVRLPVAQYEVTSPSGRVVARLDGAYPRERLGLEFDGRSVHEAPTAVARDRERQNSLVALGWTVLRFTWWDVVEDPARFTGSVARALAARESVR